jgi:hypothetical protein
VFDRVEPAVGWMPIRLVGRDILFEGVHGSGVARAVVHRAWARVPARGARRR